MRALQSLLRGSRLRSILARENRSSAGDAAADVRRCEVGSLPPGWRARYARSPGRAAGCSRYRRSVDAAAMRDARRPRETVRGAVALPCGGAPGPQRGGEERNPFVRKGAFQTQELTGAWLGHEPTTESIAGYLPRCLPLLGVLDDKTHPLHIFMHARTRAGARAAPRGRPPPGPRRVDTVRRIP